MPQERRRSDAPPISRRRLPAVLAAAPLAAGAPLLPARIDAATTRNRITRGPYLQEATAGGIALLWRTDSPATAAVDVRPADAPPDVPWFTIGSGMRSRSHTITVAGLEPNTLYHYRVRVDGDAAQEYGAFRTLPPPETEALTFVHYADNQTGHVPHAEVVRRILAEEPLPGLLIHGGDQCENGSRPEQWDQWFAIERDLLARVPVFPSLGNHEENSPLYFEHFRVPSNGTATGRGRWYSFDAGPAHFVALDVVFSDIEPGSLQYRWLDADLERTDRRWKFVYFHYPPYNASPHHRSNLRLRAALEPLFLRHRVSAIFNGHGHLYERAFGATAGPGSPPLLWIVSGGGGGVPQPAGWDSWTQYTEVTYHFLRVTIRGDRLTTVGVRLDGSEFDRFDATLNAEGRLAPVQPLVRPVIVPQPSPAQFLGSQRGALLLGYQALSAIAAPLGLSVAIPSRRRPVVPVPSGPVYVPPPRPVDPHAGWRGLPVLALSVGVAALLLLALLPTAPLRWLFGFDAYTTLLTGHAILGTALLLTAVVAANAGYRLAAGRAPSLPWLAGIVSATAALAAASAIVGNLLYAGYVKANGPMEAVIRKAPEASTVLFEFKARIGLMPLPLAVAAAYVVWSYRNNLRRDRYLAELVALLLLFLAFYVAAPFGLGAAVTRVRGIL